MTTELASRFADDTDHRSLVSLLGDSRAAIVVELRRAGERTSGQLAELLGISPAATRRHLAVLEDEDLVVAETRPEGPGRPAAHWSLTPAARRLFPQRYQHLAGQLLEFLEETQGREGLREYLRYRMERETAALSEAVDAEDLHARLEQLAAALSEAGYEASVVPTDDGFALAQHHCAILELASQHPELCAYEAASFKQVLGDDVAVSRRQTLATGHHRCVCAVTPKAPQDQPSTRR